MVVKEVIDQIEDSHSREFMHRVWKGVKYSVAGATAAIGLYSLLYTNPIDSVAVVKTFGRYTCTTGSGLHAKIPFGIQTIEKIPVKRNQKVEFGFRTLKPGIDSTYIGQEEITQGKVGGRDLRRLIESSGARDSDPEVNDLAKQALDVLRGEYLMLTGDLNMADVESIVQYDIKDPVKFAFSLKEPVETLRDCHNSIIKRLVGNGSVDEAISISRTEYESQGKVELQKVLDGFNSGINIVAVKLQSTNPPHKVRPAFHAVNGALQAKETRINEAKKEYNESVPRAAGEAAGLIETAHGYAAKRVNEARGDADKFNKVYAEYIKAPEVTRARMHYETMQKVLPSLADKLLVEDKEVFKMMSVSPLNISGNLGPGAK